MSVTVSPYVAFSGTAFFLETTGSPPPAVNSVVGTPTLKVNGVAATLSVALWTLPAENTALPFAFWTVSPAVVAGDTVTVDLPDGLIVTGSGSSAAATAAAVDNRTGVDWLPDPLTPAPTMPLGYQFDGGASFAPTAAYANLLKTADPDWKGQNGDTFGLDQGGWDSDGYAAAATTLLYKTVCNMPTGWSELATGAMYDVLPEGDYQLRFSGTAGVSVVSARGSTCALTASSAGKRSYHITRTVGDDDFGFDLAVDQTGGKTLSALAMYDSSVDADNPPLWHPRFLAQLAGNTVVRLKDFTKIDGGNSVVDFADFASPTWVTYSLSPAKYRCPVASISGVNTGPYCRDGANRMKVTFAADHPYSNGQTIYVEFPDPGSGVCTTRRTLSYTTGDPTPLVGCGGICYVLDSRNVVISGYVDRLDVTRVLAVNDFTGVGAFAAVYLSSPPPEEIFALPGAVSAACPAVFAIPHTASDACCYALGQSAAAHYQPGTSVPLYVEWSNEVWNGFAGFPQCYHSQAMGLELNVTLGWGFDPTSGGDRARCGAQYYALRSAQALDQFEAGFVAAGGDAARLKRCINSPPGGRGSGWLGLILDYSATHDSAGAALSSPYTGHIPWDVVHESTYYDVPTNNSGVDPAVWAGLTVDQCLDYLDAHAHHYGVSGYAQAFEEPIAATIASGPAAFRGLALAQYEGGPQTVLMGGVNDQRTISVWYHPRAVKPYLTQLRYYESIGRLYQIKLGMAGPIVGGSSNPAAWNAYLGSSQAATPGDGSNGSQDNRLELVNPDGTARKPDPRKLDSVIGYAVNLWNGAVTPTASFSVSPTTVVAGSGSHALTLTGSNTAWDGSTVFTVSGVSGTSKTAQSVTDGTHATVTISVGSTSGTLTVSDGTASRTVTVTPAVAASFTVSPTSVSTNGTATLTLTGSGTSWGGGTTFTVSGVAGVTKTGQSVTDGTHATASISTGSTAGTLTVSDGTATASVSVTAPTVSGRRYLLAVRL